MLTYVIPFLFWFFLFCRSTLPPLPIDEKRYPEMPRGGIGSDFVSVKGGE